MAPLLLLVAAGAPGPKPIDLPGDRLFPESIDALPDGTAFVGSMSGGVLKVSLKTGKADVWVKPGGYGTASVFGVFVDPVNKLLWVCSNDLSKMARLTVPGGDSGTHLKGFDLATGAGKVSLAFDGERAFCNDGAVAKDGTVYVTETGQSRIYRWTPGATALTLWSQDPGLAGPKGDGLDGIAFGSDGQLYVNNYRSHLFARLAIKADGTAGALTPIRTSRPFDTPDGLRAVSGMRFAQAEGPGAISVIDVSGDMAKVTTLAEGLGAATGVAVQGGQVWSVKGEVDYVWNPSLRDKTPPLPFRVTPFALPIP